MTDRRMRETPKQYTCRTNVEARQIIANSVEHTNSKAVSALKYIDGITRIRYNCEQRDKTPYSTKNIRIGGKEG